MTQTRERKADGIVDAIEAKILNGQLRPGDRLDERSLAESFNVSRTPIREALLRLVATGLIVENGRGAAAVRRPTVSALLDEFLVVSELEGLAARQSARRILESRKASLVAANERCKDAATLGDVHAFNVANMEFHDLIIDSSQNQLLMTQLRSARIVTFPYRHYVTRLPGYMLKSVDEHAKILAAIVSGDGEMAHRLMREHVNLLGEQLIDVVRMLELGEATG